MPLYQPTALTAAQESRLESLRNHSSRYEVVASRDGEIILIGYTIHKSRSGLLATLRREPAATTAVMCPKGDEMVTWLKPAIHGCTIGGWLVRFSSRTERDAIMEGELKHVAQKSLELLRRSEGLCACGAYIGGIAKGEESCLPCYESKRKHAVEQGGGVFVGLQDCEGIMPDFYIFNDPATGSTLAFPASTPVASIAQVVRERIEAAK
jgi:hypothetical protein